MPDAQRGEFFFFSFFVIFFLEDGGARRAGDGHGGRGDRVCRSLSLLVLLMRTVLLTMVPGLALVQVLGLFGWLLLFR